MSTWVENMALHAEGLDDDDIAALDACKDDLMHLAATVEAVWPRVNHVVPILSKLIVKAIAYQKQQGGLNA